MSTVPPPERPERPEEEPDEPSPAAGAGDGSPNGGAPEGGSRDGGSRDGGSQDGGSRDDGAPHDGSPDARSTNSGSPGGSSPSGDSPSPVTDDHWDAFLRDVTEGEGASAAPKEPSARARMVTRRLREQDEAAQREQRSGRRSGRLRRRMRRGEAPPPATPPGWRTGPAWQEMSGRRNRRRQAGGVIAMVLIAAVLVLALRPSLVTDHLPGHGTQAAGSPSPLPAETALPSAAPGDAADDEQPTLDRPFRGSPAEQWADGADAIELPAAEPVSGMSEADVARTLRLTKKFLVASNLDPAVLRGGQPEAALDLLDPKVHNLLSEVRQSLRRPTAEDNPLSLFTRFDPHQVRLAGDVVKARGHMSFAAAGQGRVRVTADYTFVYPVLRAGSDSGPVTRTVVRRELTVYLSDPHRWTVTKGKLGLTQWNGERFNDECGVYDGFLHPVFPDSGPTGAPGSGPAEDPYDRSHPLDDSSAADAKACGRTTRT